MQVRGSSGSASEMSYIIRHSGSCGIIVQEATTLDHLLPQLGDNVSNTNGSSAVDALQVRITPHGLGMANTQPTPIPDLLNLQCIYMRC